MSGAVKDGSGHGWPLYARIEITSLSTEPVEVFTDPVTGAYAVDLPDATAYIVRRDRGRSRATWRAAGRRDRGFARRRDWDLWWRALCDAPGYAVGTYGPPVLAESFDGGTVPPGWNVDTVSWRELGDRLGRRSVQEFDDNRTGGSGPYALLNSNCGRFATDDTNLITPPVDLSATSNAAIRWANDFINTGVTRRSPRSTSRPTAAPPGRTSGTRARPWPARGR